MPITYVTVLVGALANAGIPPFSGFFSKDSIVEALHLSTTPGAHWAYYLALAGVFVSALYSFRLVFFAFHGTPRFDVDGHGDHGGHGAEEHAADEEPGHHEMHGPPHETPWVVTVPLILLAIPSVLIGGMTLGPMVYGEWFKGAIAPSPTMEKMAEEFHGSMAMMGHAFSGPALYIALAGVALAWYLYIARPDLPAVIKRKSGVLATILERKYGFDDFNDWFFAGGARRLGNGLWTCGDKTIIDGLMVNGTARLIGWFAGVSRRLQTGMVYHYAFAMILGVFGILTWFWLQLQRF
jgi:NADH-quinone oxidoreductase subunit L